ncbi:MAG: ABC transporter ATP-binding protein [Lachnospiraceae bacterium]
MRHKVSDPGKILKRILRYATEGNLAIYIIVVVCIILSVVASVQGTRFIQTLIDEYITPMLQSGSTDFGPLLKAIMKVVLYYAVGIAATFAYQRLMINVTQGTMLRMRKEVFSRMETLPIKYFDTRSHGDIMSVYTNDIDTLRQMISQSLPQMFSSVITVAAVFVNMIIISWRLTIVSILMIFLMLFVSKKIASKSGKYFAEQQRSLGAVNGYIEEMMTGQKVVKVFNHEDEAIEEFEKLNNELLYTAYNANKYANVIQPINAQLGNVAYVVCAVVGGVLAVSGWGNLTLGGLASYLTFNRSINHPISQISMQLNSIVMALAGAERVFALLDEESEEDNGSIILVNAMKKDGDWVESDERTGFWAWKDEKNVKKVPGTTLTPLKGDVSLDHVDFGYSEDKPVLHDISIYARPGQKVAFVGTTGAGKTTITNLLNRFYDIQGGTITYDGIDIKDIKKDDLRRSLGMVLQETNLFSGTVRENIRYGRLDASDSEVEAAAILAGADSFIKTLPEGYDTMLKGDGANLSQGQRQLLSIARAAIADPPVLILDEATSSIDTRTERIVQEGMDMLMKGRTSFVIAHRLSTVKNADYIIVLEKGRIIERGNHEELLEKGGKYYQLYTGMNA